MEETEEMQVGRISHYLPKIGVAIVDIIDGSIKVGDEIHIKGHTTDFVQKVESMQIEHEKIEAALPGQSIGLKGKAPVRANDLVYRNI